MPKEDVLQPAEDAASGSNGRLPTDVRNCKFDVGRNCYVVLYKDENGNRKSKFFPCKSRAKEEVMHEAFAFAREQA